MKHGNASPVMISKPWICSINSNVYDLSYMLRTVLLFTYPFYFLILQRLGLSWLAGAIGVYLIVPKLRLFFSQDIRVNQTTLSFCLASLAIYALACMDSIDIPKLLPSIITTLLFTLFSSSLTSEEPIVFKFAKRKLTSDEPRERVREYCWYLTIAWCLFFILNLGISLDSTSRSDDWWSLYNGFISYVFIGLFFLIEYPIRMLFRRRVMKKSLIILLFLTLQLSLLVKTPESLLSEDKGGNQITLEDVSSLLRHSIDRESETERRGVTFKQSRQVRGLKFPIKSSGEIIFNSDRSLIWITLQPFKSIMLVSQSAVKFFDVMDTGAIVPTGSSSNSDIFNSVSSIIRGDIAPLLGDFKIVATGSKDKWALQVTPNGSFLQDFLRVINLSGGQELSVVELVMANDDCTLIEFSRINTELSIEANTILESFLASR